jgi:hypothetical protein
LSGRVLLSLLSGVLCLLLLAPSQAEAAWSCPKWLRWALFWKETSVSDRATPPSPLSARQIRKMKKVKSLRALDAFWLPPLERALVGSLQADLFHDQNPFSLLVNVAPVVSVLEHGVTSFERKIYRTSQNIRCWNSGYDLVHYAVTHPNGNQSHLLSYKQANRIGQYSFAGPDYRPIHHQFFVSNANATVTHSQYVSGTLLDVSTGPATEKLKMLSDFFSESIGNRGIFLLTDPDEILGL